MRCFFDVKDNDWCPFFSHQAEIGEVNFYGVWRVGYLMEITALPKPMIRA